MHRKMRDRFSVTMRTREGHQFNAQFGDPGAYPRPRKEIQNLPHRAVVTHRDSVAKAGDLVVYDGVEYLLCGQHVMANLKRFLAVEINARVRWVRAGDVIDPVTLMKRSWDEVELDPQLSVTREPGRAFEEADFKMSQNRMFTYADVQLGDRLDDMKVILVEDLFGIRMLEVA